jgi:hypothetical protein
MAVAPGTPTNPQQNIVLGNYLPLMHTPAAFGYVWCGFLRRLVMNWRALWRTGDSIGGVTNRPSPQSPKGILGSTPPHLECSKTFSTAKPFIFNRLTLPSSVKMLHPPRKITRRRNSLDRVACSNGTALAAKTRPDGEGSEIPGLRLIRGHGWEKGREFRAGVRNRLADQTREGSFPSGASP